MESLSVILQQNVRSGSSNWFCSHASFQYTELMINTIYFEKLYEHEAEMLHDEMEHISLFRLLIMGHMGHISVLVIPDRLLGSVQWGHHRYLTVRPKPRHDIPTCRDTKTNTVLFYSLCHFQTF